MRVRLERGVMREYSRDWRDDRLFIDPEREGGSVNRHTEKRKRGQREKERGRAV